jgi:hypothetical protein
MRVINRLSQDAINCCLVTSFKGTIFILYVLHVTNMGFYMNAHAQTLIPEATTASVCPEQFLVMLLFHSGNLNPNYQERCL